MKTEVAVSFTKVVYCDMESEGSERQTSGLRNTTFIAGYVRLDELKYQNKFLSAKFVLVLR